MTARRPATGRQPYRRSAGCQLIRRAQEESGLGVRAFARYLAGMVVRDPQTVRRWISGKHQVPAQVVTWLEGYVVPPKRKGRT
jgi:hypothetical protein